MSDIKQRIIDYSNKIGLDPKIALATIEAETGFNNKNGDNGQAYGYGQVWPKWHWDKFQKVAKDMGVSLPAQPKTASEEIKFNSQYASNDEFSLRVALETIKGYWNGVGQNWDKFTRSYVGPAIPQNDYNRRLTIWNKYNNGSTSTTSGTINVVDLKSKVNSMSNDELKKYAVVGLGLAVLSSLV